MISHQLTTVVVAADVGLVGLLLATLALAARAERRTRGSAPIPDYVLAGIALAAWAAFDAVLAHAGAFATTHTTTAPAIALGIAAPIVVGVALMRRPAVRARLERVPLAWMIGVQLYRIVGGVFLVAYLVEDALPAEFALPAGIGDVLVGLAAPVVAYLVATGRRAAPTAALAWCVLGVADLVIAVGTGFLTAPSTFQQLALGDPNLAITRYPLVLIPTFAVPVSILLHLGVLARLGGLSRTARSGVRPIRARPA